MTPTYIIVHGIYVRVKITNTSRYFTYTVESLKTGVEFIVSRSDVIYDFAGSLHDGLATAFSFGNSAQVKGE